MKRYIFHREKEQRGCCYCADAIVGVLRVDKNKKSQPVFVEEAKYCPYSKCPYHELDNCSSYTEWLKKQDKQEATVKKLRSTIIQKKVIK